MLTSDQKVGVGIAIVASFIIGGLFGILGLSIYRHETATSTNVRVVVQGSAKKWITNVSCSVNQVGQYTANGFVNSTVEPPVLIRIDAEFFGTGPKNDTPEMTGYTYFDTSDPALGLQYGGIGGFSIVTLDAGIAPTSEPTSCIISATDSYNSGFHL